MDLRFPLSMLVASHIRVFQFWRHGWVWRCTHFRIAVLCISYLYMECFTDACDEALISQLLYFVLCILFFVFRIYTWSISHMTSRMRVTRHSFQNCCILYFVYWHGVFHEVLTTSQFLYFVFCIFISYLYMECFTCDVTDAALTSSQLLPGH